MTSLLSWTGEDERSGAGPGALDSSACPLHASVTGEEGDDRGVSQHDLERPRHLRALALLLLDGSCEVLQKPADWICSARASGLSSRNISLPCVRGE